MKTNKPIIFLGTEDFSAASLEALISSNFEVAGVVTKPDSKRGRGQKLTPPKVKIIAEEHNIPVLQPAEMSEIVPFVENLPTRPIGVLVSFGRIIPQEIIDLFDGGIVNVHPSLLPKYRGPSPIETAILNGDSETGVSIMSLIREMDAGPVYAQEKFALAGSETSSQLYKKCEEIGARMLVEILPKIISGEAVAREQNHDEATYCHMLSKEFSPLRLSEQTAQQAEQQIRAFETFPKSKIEIDNHTVIINQAEVVSKENLTIESKTTIKFADGNFLKITQLTAPSGKKMSAEAFENGYLK